MTKKSSNSVWKIALSLVISVTAVGAEIAYLAFPQPHSTVSIPQKPEIIVPQTVEATDRQAHEMCAACHAYTDPSNFPRSVWRSQVENGYAFLAETPLPIHPPPIENMVHYFENRASTFLPLPDKDHSGPCPIQFHPTRYSVPGTSNPIISNVNLVHLSSQKFLDVLVCDMGKGRVMLMKPYEKSPHFQILAKLQHPCRTQVVDLDGDGIKDILVADLGEFRPTDSKVGRVIWLHGHADGTYTPYTLLSAIGRVDDVEMADFDGDGHNDLIVAEFGHTHTGSILWLQNETTDWTHPQFIPHELDGRAGTIHVPVSDLNHDGKPDFTALISNEHETVVAFINQGHGRFLKNTIFTGSSPALGSDSIQLTRLNPSQKQGVLYAAGDMFDTAVPRHIQGVYWLDNRGAYPYTVRKLTTMYGAMRAISADVNKNGRPGIFAVSLTPDLKQWLNPATLDSIVYLNQTATGKFERYALEKGSCNHATCDTGDIFGDGNIDLVTGNFNFSPTHDSTAITIWRNTGLRSRQVARR